MTDVSCPGRSNGAIDINVTGGSGHYTFLWSSGQMTQNITGIPAGSYTVTVTDADYGATAPFTQVVGTVPDTTPPTIMCLSSPQNRQVAVGTCAYTATGTEFDPTSVTDNCTLASVTWVLSGATTGSGANTLAGVAFNKGTTAVTWTATDTSANASSCTFNVGVTIPPGST